MTIKAAAASIFKRKKMIGLSMGSLMGLAGCTGLGGGIMGQMGWVGFDANLDQQIQGVCYSYPDSAIYQRIDQDGNVATASVNVFLAQYPGAHDYASVKLKVNGRIYYGGSYTAQQMDGVQLDWSVPKVTDGDPANLPGPSWFREAVYEFGYKAISDAVREISAGHRACSDEEMRSFNPSYVP